MPRSKAVQADAAAIKEGKIADNLKMVMEALGLDTTILQNTSYGSGVFACRPGDGSAREQAASCQRVLGGGANIAYSYATKRYRSNLINWGMLPFLIDEGELPFAKGDFLFVPDIRKAIEERQSEIAVYVNGDKERSVTLRLGSLTDAEREIILKGCLINYYRG